MEELSAIIVVGAAEISGEDDEDDAIWEKVGRGEGREPRQVQVVEEGESIKTVFEMGLRSKSSCRPDPCHICEQLASRDPTNPPPNRAKPWSSWRVRVVDLRFVGTGRSVHGFGLVIFNTEPTKVRNYVEGDAGEPPQKEAHESPRLWSESNSRLSGDRGLKVRTPTGLQISSGRYATKASFAYPRLGL